MTDDERLKNETEFVRFMLETPFSYSTKSGEQETATFIELRPPTTRNSRECAALKQAFMRSAHEQEDSDGDGGGEGKVEGDEEGPDALGIMSVIAMSKDVDMPDTLEVARKLFTSGRVAFVEGEMKLTPRLLEEMDQDDFERMVGTYLVNFTLASVLARVKKSSSKQ